MKNLLPILLVTLFVHPLLAQSNYKAGYVVTPKNDTLTGYINNQDWSVNPDKISFKKTLNGQKTEFSPSTAREFFVGNKKYISASVDVYTGSRETPELTESVQPQLKKINAFLQVLVSGDKNLYYFINHRGVTSFYIGEPGKIQILEYHKYLMVNDDGFNKIIENKKFIRQLAVYLTGCSNLNREIRNLRYIRSALNHLFLSYYKCKNKRPDFEIKKEKVRITYGIIGGPSVANVKFSGKYHLNVTNVDYKSAVSFNGGMFLNVAFAGNLYRWSLENELMYTSFKTNGQYTENFINDSYRITKNTVGLSYLTINNLLRYSYTPKNFTVYFNAGVSNSYVIGQVDQQKIETNINGSVTYENGTVLDEGFKKYNLGVISGIGVNYKKLMLEFRFEKLLNFVRQEYITANTSKYNLLLYYRIK